MPNWCYTNITICHNDEKKLKEFFDKVEKWAKTPYVKNGFDYPNLDYYWLGNIVGNSGLAKWEKISEERTDFVPNIACRGTLTQLEFQGNHININTETAWAPMMKMWQLLVDKELPDAQIWFSAEEGGMGIYETNDPDMIGRYFIDVCDAPPERFEDIDSEYEASKDYVVSILQRVLKTKEEDVDVLIKQLEESDIEWLYVHPWEEYSIDDCE